MDQGPGVPGYAPSLKPRESEKESFVTFSQRRHSPRSYGVAALEPNRKTREQERAQRSPVLLNDIHPTLTESRRDHQVLRSGADVAQNLSTAHENTYFLAGRAEVHTC